jgi:excisionase family DNA binding protein
MNRMPGRATPDGQGLDDLLGTGKVTCSVPEAGRLLGLSRHAAYAAARSNALPVIRVGRRVLVKLPALKAMLQDHDHPTASWDYPLAGHTRGLRPDASPERPSSSSRRA